MRVIPFLLHVLILAVTTLGLSWAIRLADFPPPSGSVIKLTNDAGVFVGSACVVGHRGDRTYLLTARHVIGSGARRCERGVLKLERMTMYPDLALVSVKGSFGRAWALGDGLQLREEVRLLGFTHPPGIEIETFGRVANPGMGWIDGAVHPGMSGGPVVNERNELDGMIIAMFDHTAAVVVPLEQIRWMIP